ncbi:MAG: CotH kinase family protein, partial [Planctomycetota bacterium]|nr:CotH kinase family protein [Planctomycetota bacterium]
VELHNPGDTRVSLEGWRLSDAVDFPFPPETILEPGGYLVVAADPPTFEERYGVTALGPYEGRLANDEERLDLRDSWGNVLDRVHYADDGTWPEQADARGASLELAHPDLDNRFGAAWRASRPGGSPGQRNESFSVDVTPRVAAVRHDPPMPSTRDAVRVTCRVLDNGPLRQVVLSWSRDGGGGGGDVGMNDSGMDGDDTAGDGLYTAVIPAQPDGSTVRFTITASDAISGETAPGNGRFYLYEVNSTPAVRSDIPHYTILMTRDNWRRLRSRGNGSDRLLDGTFVDHQRGDVYYNVGVRYRGNGTRNPPDGRFNYRVQFGDDRKFQGLKRLNFNSQNPHRQFMGNNTFRRLGIPYPLTVPVALRFEAAVDVGYVRLEAYDEDFLGRFFGRDDGGNLYRALRGRLEFLGFDPNDYNGRYRKQTNEEDGDFSDLIDLLRSFEIRDDDAFSREIQQRIDVREWILYFAAQGALGNNENSINLDAGDDYFLYSRPSDGRFFILPWDSDSVFVDATQALFRPSSAAVRRLLAHPHFAPLYYCALDAIQETYLSEEAIGKRLARVADIYSENQVASIRDFVALRNRFLDANVPRELSVSTDREQRDFLVARGDEWAYWRGVTHPSRGDLSWTELDFEDRGWPVGPSGFGYGDGDDATLIDDMRDRYPTVFVRRKFRIEDAAAVETLTLWVDYDDGFVAYLNGREIARRNFSGDIPSHTDTATRDREAGTEERFRLDDFLDEVRDGENVLALVVFNGTLDSSDLSLIPSLEVELRDHVVACGDVLMTPESQITLNGSAPGCGTASVLVGGSAANYVPRQGSWEAVVDLRPGPNHLEILALDAVGRPVMSETLVVERTTGLTPLPGRIRDDLRLSAAEGPYLLDGEVVVERGAELVVEGGAELLVSQGSRLVVLGRLHVAGSAAEPVVFRPSRCGLTWRGILLEGDGGGRPHRLEGCELRSGAPGADGFVQIDGGRLEVRDARFTEIDGTAVGAFESEVTAERVEIVGSRRGFVLKGGRLTLEDSRLAGITDEGIDADAGGVVVRGCRISAGGAAVLLRGGSHEIRETLFWASGTGISVDAGTSLSGDHNTLAGNALGVRSAAGAGAVFLSSHVVWGNGLGVAGEASFEFSDVQGAVPPGPGNISANPLFTAPERGNFELSPGSPAIGAGRDGTDMGAFPSGGGAVRFVRGDSDSNGAVNLSDAVRTLLYLFQGAGPVRCPDAADANDDGGINLTDPIFLLNYLFLGGSPPPPPFPQEGVDPSGDGLDCSP